MIYLLWIDDIPQISCVRNSSFNAIVARGGNLPGCVCPCNRLISFSLGWVCYHMNVLIVKIVWSPPALSHSLALLPFSMKRCSKDPGAMLVVPSFHEPRSKHISLSYKLPSLGYSIKATQAETEITEAITVSMETKKKISWFPFPESSRGMGSDSPSHGCES